MKSLTPDAFLTPSLHVSFFFFLFPLFCFFLFRQALGAKLTIYLAAVIGAITATGSVTAFAKLQVWPVGFDTYEVRVSYK